MEEKQPCKFVTKKFVKKAPDEDEKIESDDEIFEKKNPLVLPDEKVIEKINNDFDELEIPQQKLVFAFLTRAREEFYVNRFPMASKLDYVRWIIYTELQYFTNWEVLKEILGKRKIRLKFPIECKEIAKWNFICIVKYKFKGKVIGEYKGKEKCVECICEKGHKCYPQVGSVFRGNGICKICAGNDFESTKARFYHIIEVQYGGKVVGEYKGVHISIKCICPYGHICNTRPDGVLHRGDGMCKVCAKNDFETAKNEFYENLERLGGEALENYTGSNNKIKCRCPKGHICYPRPYTISIGHNMCKICSLKEGQSRGEKLLIEALKKLDIGIVEENYTPDLIKKNSTGSQLRYDATIIKEGKTYFYEYHGRQHEGFVDRFHKTQENFLIARQRDLVKIYVAKKMKAKLIVLDNTWVKKPIEEWVEYLQQVTFSKEQIVAESPLHEWVHTEIPTEESLERWTNN